MPVKRKLNAYFKLMTEAKKNKTESFEYNGNTYIRSKTQKGFIVYKKK